MKTFMEKVKWDPVISDTWMGPRENGSTLFETLTENSRLFRRDPLAEYTFDLLAPWRRVVTFTASVRVHFEPAVSLNDFEIN